MTFDKKPRRSKLFEITLNGIALTGKLSLNDKLVFSSKDDYIRIRSCGREVCRLQKDDNYLWELSEYCIFTPKFIFIPPMVRFGSEVYISLGIEIIRPVHVTSKTLTTFLSRISFEECSHGLSETQVPEVDVDLKPHQREALKFMYGLENASSWEMLGDGMFYSIPQGKISFSSDFERELRGGILADQMGLGKTRSMISLVKTGGSTLVVCPLTVVSQWIQEAEDACLKATLYYGAEKRIGHLTITTYGTLGSEFKKKSLLFQNWDRIILDEAHIIKSPQTNNFKACYALNAWNRWCVTGTPIINTTEDVFTMLKFLRKEVDATNIEKTLKECMIRRTKDERDSEGNLILQLPRKHVKIEYLEFTEEERWVYDELFKKSKQLLQGKTIVHVFAQLIRMRQLCCHPELVKCSEINSNPLAEECSVCLDAKVDRILPCDHEICSKCLNEIINYNLDKGISRFECIICRSEYIENQVKISICSDDSQEKTPTSSSTKIAALLRHIKNLQDTWKHQKSSEREHVVIFSQFTTFLEVISHHLSLLGLKHVKLLGRMNRDERQKSITAFQKKGYPIILASLRCAGLGVTLTRGSKLFMMDPWWNSAIEEQAIDRVHRMGQQREVEIIRFIIKETVEERLLAIQDRKLEAVEKLDIGKELLDVFN